MRGAVGSEGSAPGDVERFSSPTRRWLGFSTTVLVAGSLFIGYTITDSTSDPVARTAGTLLVGGIWGGIMSMLSWLPTVRAGREVTLGPGVLIVRTWWEVLRRRPGANEWVEPSSSSLLRGRTGECKVLPIGPNLGRQPKRLVDAFERAGFSVQDDLADWQAAHQRSIRLVRRLGAIGIGLIAAGAFAGLVLNQIWPGAGLFVVGVAVLLGAALIEQSWRPARVG